MSVRELASRPGSMAHVPDCGYRWLELWQDDAIYGHAAIRELEDAVELHLEMHSWRKSVFLELRRDLDWLRAETRRLGKARILGMRAGHGADVDEKLCRFAGLMGFGNMLTIQVMELRV